MTSVAILILIVIFIIFMCKIHNLSKLKKAAHTRGNMQMPERRCSFPMCRCPYGKCKCQHAMKPMYARMDHSDSQLHGSHDHMEGLNDIEQDTQMRGFVPSANQPDHTGNLWKSDQSQVNTGCHGATKMHSYEADIETPMRGKVVNMVPTDVSNMHIMSRFGCTSS